MNITECEMRGVLTGKALPADILVGESLSVYLVRIFNSLNAEVDDRAAMATSDKETIRQLQQQVSALAVECGIMRQLLPDYVSVPVTDAAIRELQAQAMDSLAGVAETMLVKFSNAGASEIPEAFGWKLLERQAIQSAYFLRNGEQGGDHA